MNRKVDKNLQKKNTFIKSQNWFQDFDLAFPNS